VNGLAMATGARGSLGRQVAEFLLERLLPGPRRSHGPPA
jgi:hypothetical protein